VGVELNVFTDRVADPDPETELGLKLPIPPEGNPLTLKFTVPVDPLEGVMFHTIAIG
jgi:hypothetical protein